MTNTNKEIVKKLNKLILKLTNSLENDIAAITVNDDEPSSLDKKRLLVNILFKLTSSIIKLHQMHDEAPPQITSSLTIEDNRVINNYLKKLNINE